MDHDKKLIRNSTAEFLVFTAQAGEKSIEARYEDDTVWLPQKLMFESDFDRVMQQLANKQEPGEH